MSECSRVWKAVDMQKFSGRLTGSWKVLPRCSGIVTSQSLSAPKISKSKIAIAPIFLRDRGSNRKDILQKGQDVHSEFAESQSLAMKIIRIFKSQRFFVQECAAIAAMSGLRWNLGIEIEKSRDFTALRPILLRFRRCPRSMASGLYDHEFSLVEFS